MALLLSEHPNESNQNGESPHETVTHPEIQHAPIIAEDILAQESRDSIPQYGLLGSFGNQKMFLNTNVPFSTFVCGVQGSGKSHTVSCILENSLIPSPILGRMESPLSALVLSYSQFGSDGSGFNISEAAFLAAPHAQIPGRAHVKRVNVLVSPSNYHRISKLYLRLPNTTVSQFKLKPRNLNIDIMLTLMNVSETNETPLYMAAVRKLLRDMVTEGADFDYYKFKNRLRNCFFSPIQRNMLQIRLDVLESFLISTTLAQSQALGKMRSQFWI